MPGECNCLPQWNGTLCDNPTCLGQQPTPEAFCTPINLVPTWVINGTLVIATSYPVLGSVVVVGDFIIAENGQLIINTDSTITVSKCPVINGSLSVELDSDDQAILSQSGQVNVTVLKYDPLCNNVGEFQSLTVDNPSTLYELCVRMTTNRFVLQLIVLISRVSNKTTWDN